jgi:molybdopterin synthase catalytic subunit
MQIFVSVQKEDFDVAVLSRALRASSNEVGALATFVGCMRGSSKGQPLAEMFLEHYPGMTERSIRNIVEEACQRWPLFACSVVHRIGHLSPGDHIVFVGVASAHRGDAFQACEYIMDFLKSKAPFWKKEISHDGSSHWVDARVSDDEALQRWMG